MNRKIPFAKGEIYHLYNRGVDKRVIFRNKKEKERFQLLLYICNNSEHVRVSDILLTKYDSIIKQRIVNIIGYCLMDNHFHLLVKEIEDGGISRFMKKLQTSYSMYFNILNGRTGALFQGKFKSKYINSDEYLKYIMSYIHLNPAKFIDKNWKENKLSLKNKNIKSFINQYPFSSFIDYKDKKRLESKILDIDNSLFEGVDFDKDLEFWLNFKPE